MSVSVLGAGAMGSLLAHDLALSGNLAPSLLLRTRAAVESYKASGGEVTIVRPSPNGPSSSSVKIDASFGQSAFQAQQRKIENLVVATKTYNTVQALEPFVPFIGPETNIMLLQNGMGVYSTLKSTFWGKSPMPNFFHAISTHGAYRASGNVVHHVGLGSLVVSQLPTQHEPISTPPASPFFNELMGSSNLNASFVAYPEFLLKQMEKLVVNACINPLTATLDCLNGDLLHGKRVYSIMRKVISECVECFRAEYGDTLSAEARVVLSKDRLLSTVLDVCRNTAQNSSSMREDLYRLNQTEIDSINGYIVHLGWKHRISVPANRMLVDMVKDKLTIERKKENYEFGDTQG